MLRLQVKTVRDIFNNATMDNLSRSYLLNSLLYFCLLCLGSDFSEGESLPSELSYLVKKQPLQESVALVDVLGALLDVAPKLLDSPRQR